MRRVAAGLAITFLFWAPVGGRLLRQTHVAAASSHNAGITEAQHIEKPLTHPIHAGITEAQHIDKPFSHPIDDLQKLQKKREYIQQGCPRECACKAGDGTNGGTNLISGMCFDHCSEKYEKFENLRFCGSGDEYTKGDSIDCRRCKEPEYFGASYEVYHSGGVHEPERSMIMLGPWNGTQGWMFNWTIKWSEQIEPTVRKNYRFLDVAPKHLPDKDFGAWYGYANQDDWWTDTPIKAEVNQAVAYVHYLIEKEYKVVGDYRRIVLAGLSQGASLALEAAIRFPHELGLVLTQRGIVSKERRHSSAKPAKSPYLMFMGEEDHYYGVDLAKKSCRFLRLAGNQVFLKTIPGLDHDSDEGDGRIHEWRLTVRSLAAVLAQKPSGAAEALAKVADSGAPAGWSSCG